MLDYFQWPTQNSSTQATESNNLAEGSYHTGVTPLHLAPASSSKIVASESSAFRQSQRAAVAAVQ